MSNLISACQIKTASQANKEESLDIID